MHVDRALIDSLETSLSNSREQVMRLIRERDEARERLAAAEAALIAEQASHNNTSTQLNKWRFELMAERDDARQRLAASEDLIAHLRISEDGWIDENKHLTARLAEAEAERDVERRDRTAAEFEMLADRELLRELYEHEINEYGRWTAGMCQRVCVAAKGGRDEI